MRAPFVAELRLFSFGFAPAGWTECDGRLLDIHEHQPLFSLVGWRYGGDYSTTFGVPALASPPSPFTWCIALEGMLARRAGDHPVDEPFIGEIRMFAGQFAPAGWIVCDGRRLPIEAPHDALYDVIGTTYGGDADGFNVPDLRNQSPAAVTFIIAAAGVPPRRV
jgi:microcystin-dependent protein